MKTTLAQLRILVLIACTFLGGSLDASVARAESRKPPGAPNLVMLIVVDQFRADYLTRYQHLLSERGFKRLMKLGATFPFGEYDLLQSMTGPGHAVIATGANPHYSGIAGNHWFDAAAGKRMYCVEDATSAVVPESSAKPGTGFSPKNLIASTFGDELKNAAYGSRVVSIALKDRASILMGGHRADLALWYSEPSGSWVSSRYYLPEGKLPAFAEILNASLLKRRQNGADAPGLLATPFGVQITIEAVEMAWNHYGFGKKTSPDVLAVSFSSFDYAGHAHGPNSPEIEAMLVSQDKAIASLLDLAEKRVPGGLSKTLVALTADHGVAPVPESLDGRMGGRIDDDALRSQMESALQEKFGRAPKDSKWVLASESLHFFLNLPALAQKEIALEAAEAVAKAAIEKNPFVFRVVTSTEIVSRRLPFGFLERQILNTFFPTRSGQVLLIPKPFFIPQEAKTTHVTGYAYDRQVPIVLAGPGIKPGRYVSQAHVKDVAPTLAFLMGTLSPALSEGRVLSEIVHGN